MGIAMVIHIFDFISKTMVQPDSLQTWWGCALGRSLSSVVQMVSGPMIFLFYMNFFIHFFEYIGHIALPCKSMGLDLKVNRDSNASLTFLTSSPKPSLPDSLQTWWGCALGGSLPSLFKWSRSSDFWIFYEFFCSFLGKS